MEQANEALKTISMVLAICSGIVPILFGFVIWKMSMLFVSQKDWAEYKQEAEKKHEKHERERERLETKLESELKYITEKLDKILDKVNSK